MLAPPHRQQPNSPKMTRRATARRASWISNDYGDPKYGTKVPQNLSRFASHHPFFGMMCIYIYIIGIHMFEPFLYHMNIHRLTSTLLYWHADWTLCKGADTLSCFTLDGLALWFLWCWALQRFYCVPPPQSRSNSSALYLQYTMVI